jgi:hypothetical protein
MKDEILMRIQQLSEDLEKELSLRSSLICNLKDTDTRIDRIKVVIYELAGLVSDK